MKFTLASTYAKELEKYKVKASDRTYQFWERNALSIHLWSRASLFAEAELHTQQSCTTTFETLPIRGRV